MIEGVVNAAYEPVVVLSDAAETTPLVANLLCVKSCFRVIERAKAYRHTCGTAGYVPAAGCLIWEVRMERDLSILPLLALLILSSCAPHGHWGNYARWHHSCPDFPSLAEVERVLEEKSAIVEELQEEGLIWSADATKCPEGLNRFFGVPFRFLNV